VLFRSGIDLSDFDDIKNEKPFQNLSLETIFSDQQRHFRIAKKSIINSETAYEMEEKLL